MTFTYKEMAKYYGVDDSTFSRHLKKLKAEGKFIKTSIGASFNEVDALTISKLLGFSIPDLQTTASEKRLNFK